MTIFLIGYMGSGKSTVGQNLAEVLQYQFVDLDRYIEIKEGMKIVEIFRLKGEIHFRKLENQYLKEVITFENAVIAFGGGTPCYGNNMQLISASKNSKSIYLKASIPVLTERLFAEKSLRPLISHLNTLEDLSEFIGKHLFERSPFYNRCDLIILTDKKGVNEITNQLVASLS